MHLLGEDAGAEVDKLVDDILVEVDINCDVLGKVDGDRDVEYVVEETVVGELDLGVVDSVVTGVVGPPVVVDGQCPSNVQSTLQSLLHFAEYSQPF